MSMSQVVVKDLCQILVKSNLQLCRSIKEDGLDVQQLYNHFRNTAKKINELSKLIETDEIPENQPRCKEERQTQYEDQEYDKLIDRIEKLKKSRNILIKNGTR